MNEELVFNPTRLDLSRSAFNLKRPDKGTGFVGRLNTLRPIEVMPGDTFDINCANLIRFTTPVNPTMDNLFMDVFFYYTSNEMLLRRQSFSPSLLDGNHSFAAIMGAQDGYINMPFPDNGLKIPTISYLVANYNPAESNQVGKMRAFALQLSLLDQLGYPLGGYTNATGDSLDIVGFDGFSCLPLLGYISIWNEDFREPNTQNRFALTIDGNIAKFESDVQFHTIVDNDLSGDFRGNDYGSVASPLVYDDAGEDASYHFGETGYDESLKLVIAEPFGVSRFHGLFGSLLPFPQRNQEPVYLPLGELAPVITGAKDHYKVGDDAYTFRLSKVTTITGSDASGYKGPIVSGAGNGGVGYKNVNGGQATTYAADNGYTVGDALVPSNLYADLSQATAASINTIRVAFQTQKWFEALARGGNSDLDEYINSLFGVVGPMDVVAKRPVYLGGKRIPISVSQVNNTGNNTGETGAFSLTTDDDHYCKLVSKTYGMIFCVFCIRYADSFIDAPQKFLTKLHKFDFYSPQFANLGEEGYVKGLLGFNYDDTEMRHKLDDDVMGYQEYAADYRYDFGAVSGQLRFAPENSWHYGVKLETDKMDIGEWLDASSMAMVVDRTLKVSGKTAYYQFFYDFLIYGNKYRPLPVHSIPGLVDHH